MTALTYTYGLPGCGKSTWAREQQAIDPNIVLVSRDDLRLMLHNMVFNPRNERLTETVEKMIVVRALQIGRDVIVHDTNLDPKWPAAWERVAEEWNADCYRESFVHVPLETCLERNAKRTGHEFVPEAAIRSMHERYLA